MYESVCKVILSCWSSLKCSDCNSSTLTFWHSRSCRYIGFVYWSEVVTQRYLAQGGKLTWAWLEVAAEFTLQCCSLQHIAPKGPVNAAASGIGIIIILFSCWKMKASASACSPDLFKPIGHSIVRYQIIMFSFVCGWYKFSGYQPFKWFRYMSRLMLKQEAEGQVEAVHSHFQFVVRWDE